MDLNSVVSARVGPDRAETKKHLEISWSEGLQDIDINTGVQNRSMIE